MNARVAHLIRHAGAVIFDFDDTLAETMRSRWPLLIKTAEQFDVDVTEDMIRAVWGVPFPELVTTLVPSVDRVLFESAYLQTMHSTPPTSTPGTRELLEFLAAQGTELAIVSSSRRDLVVMDIARLGIADFFRPEDIFGTEQLLGRKPDPRVLRRPVQRFADRGIGREAIVSIGDGINDYRVASGNDVAFVAVLTGLASAEDFVAAGLTRDLVVPNFVTIQPWFSS
ncbi:HAD family hydrolase [Nocardia caishijiensis]|uniref:Phosphoglycolate phosphatase-like HAD superfamily hydrolase n=1 Tax=Nocardia caishijiensis TaxID=184756 RepID=A0ABQ6YMJ9_9NOCA|nr:HAD hydrolase-like protein [Nocardia caishijiensis]KAF0847019.1 phosphoglycolate phosphatase-like HAD superfamily hydrolase [Nocardia caishijiensis]